MPLFYADGSALVKLVRDEPESGALGPSSPTLTSSPVELVLARGSPRLTPLPLDALIARAGEARLAGLRTVRPGG